MPDSDKELADKLDAQDRLIARGYVRVTCKACDGLGISRRDGLPCYQCDGRGFYWRAPISK